jgi:hypothetical protein
MIESRTTSVYMDLSGISGIIHIYKGFRPVTQLVRDGPHIDEA